MGSGSLSKKRAKKRFHSCSTSTENDSNKENVSKETDVVDTDTESESGETETSCDRSHSSHSPQTTAEEASDWAGPGDDVTPQWAGREEDGQWEGPRTVIIPRREGAGFGFTLRHFVVYPPEVVIQDAEIAESDYDSVQKSKRTKLTRQEPMDTIFVKHLKHNGPACRAGLKLGDRLVSVNGQSVRGKTYTQVIGIIQASESALKLLVVPRDEDILQVAYKSSAYESGPELSGYIHSPETPVSSAATLPGALTTTTTTTVPGGRLPGYSLTNVSNGQHSSPVFRSELRFHSLDKAFDDSPESSGREDSIRDSSEPPGSSNSSRRGSFDHGSRGSSAPDEYQRVSAHSLSVLPARARQANVDIHQFFSPPPPQRTVSRTTEDERETTSRSSSESSNRWSAPIHENHSVQAYRASLLKSQEDLYGRRPSLSKSNTTGQLGVDKRVPLSILPQPYTSIMAQSQRGSVSDRSTAGGATSRSSSAIGVRYLPAYGSNPSMFQPAPPRVTIHRRKSLDDMLEGQRGETRVGIEAKGSGHVMKIEKVTSSGTSVSVSTSPSVSVTVKRVDSPVNPNLVAQRTRLFESGLQNQETPTSKMRNQYELRKMAQTSRLNSHAKQQLQSPESPARSQISVNIRNHKEQMRQQFFASANMFASPEVDLSVSSPDIREQDRSVSPTLGGTSTTTTTSVSKCELTKRSSIGPVRQAQIRSTEEYEQGKLAAAARAVRQRSYLSAVQAPVERYSPKNQTQDIASDSDAESASTYAAMVKSASYSLSHRRDSDPSTTTTDRTTSQSSYSSVDSPSYKDNDVFTNNIPPTTTVTHSVTYSTNLANTTSLVAGENHLSQNHPGVVFRKKSEEEDNEVKLFRRISYLKATARDRGHLSLRFEPSQETVTPDERDEEEEEENGEEIADIPTTPTKVQSIRKLKSFFGERVSKTPRILEATRPTFTDTSTVGEATSDMTSCDVAQGDVTSGEQLTEGVLLCKMTQLDGKRYSDRSWRSYWCSLAEGHPYMYKERRDNVPSSSSYSASLDEQPIPVQDCRVDVAADYLKKRKQVLRLATNNGAEYLLQAEDRDSLVQWYEALQAFTVVDDDDEEKPGIASKRAYQDTKTSPQVAPKTMKKLVSFRARSPHSPGPKTKESPRSKEKYWKRLEERKEIKTWRGKVVKTMKRFGSQAETSHHVIEENEIEMEDVTFGVPLESCPPSSYSENVPLVVELCASIIEHRGLDYTGIYRVPGNSVAIQTLQDELNRGTVNLDNEKWLDVNVVGSLIKLFFRQLPIPLITAELYQAFIGANRVDNAEKRMLSLKRLIHELPESHFETLKFMAAHLSKVAQNGSKNKMDSKNLAIVFGPTLIRGRNDDKMAMVIDMSDQCRIIETIINHNEWFFSSWDVDNEVPVDSIMEEVPSTLAGTETRVSGSIDEDEREAIASRQLMASIIAAAQRKLRERDNANAGITSTSSRPEETVHEERNIDEEVAKRRPQQEKTLHKTRESLQAARLAFLSHQPHDSQDSLDLTESASTDRFSKLITSDYLVPAPRRHSEDLSPETREVQRNSFHTEICGYERQVSSDREKIDDELARTRIEMERDEGCLSEFLGRTQSLSRHIEDVTQKIRASPRDEFSGPHPAPRVSVYNTRSRSYGNLVFHQEFSSASAPLRNSVVRRSLDSLCDVIKPVTVTGDVPNLDLTQSFSSSDDGCDLLTSLTTTFDQKLRILLDPKTKFKSVKYSPEDSERSKDENSNQVARYSERRSEIQARNQERARPDPQVGIASRFERHEAANHDTTNNTPITTSPGSNTTTTNTDTSTSGSGSTRHQPRDDHVPHRLGTVRAYVSEQKRETSEVERLKSRRDHRRHTLSSVTEIEQVLSTLRAREREDSSVGKWRSKEDLRSSASDILHCHSHLV